jgi:hypothetical protein
LICFLTCVALIAVVFPANAASVAESSLCHGLPVNIRDVANCAGDDRTNAPIADASEVPMADLYNLEVVPDGPADLPVAEPESGDSSYLIATSLPFTSEAPWDAALRAAMTQEAILGLSKRGTKTGYYAMLTNSGMLGYMVFGTIAVPAVLLLRRRSRLTRQREEKRSAPRRTRIDRVTTSGEKRFAAETQPRS